MRIIAGLHRGRTLASLRGGDDAARLRPTADRVRESLFNVLAASYGDPVTGARVLDLFAGTGALGLEALSRGAASVSFIEHGRKALSLLAENIELCRAAGETRIFPLDACKPGKNPDAPHDLVFLDPPYGKQLGEAAFGAVLAGGWIAQDALIVWEESSAITPPEGVHLIEERRYGDTVIRFLERVK